MTNDIANRIAAVIDTTRTYDFPFLADETTKEAVIRAKKASIEDQFRHIAPVWPGDALLAQWWAESAAAAAACFDSLPPKARINGFYLQELMHRYAACIGKFILSENQGE